MKVDTLHAALALHPQQAHARGVVRELLLLHRSEIAGADAVARLRELHRAFGVRDGRRENRLPFLERKLARQGVLYVAEGLAPAWIGLAECDPLFDDGIAYADKLRAGGVPVELEIYRGVTHEFIKMGRILPEARQAHADAAAALRGALGTT